LFRVFILNNCVFCAALGAGNEQQGSRYKVQGKKFVYPEKHLVPRRRINTVYFGGEKTEAERCMSCGTCIFCDICVEKCPQEAITRNGEIFTIDSVKCTGCYTCVNVCPRGAIQEDFFEDFTTDELGD